MAGFAGLFDQVEYGFGDIFRTGTLTHRNLCHVVGSDVLDGFGSGNFSCMEVLEEESVFGIRPQRTLVEVTRTYRVDLDPERSKLQCERLGQSDAAEFSAGVCEVGL